MFDIQGAYFTFFILHSIQNGDGMCLLNFEKTYLSAIEYREYIKTLIMWNGYDRMVSVHSISINDIDMYFAECSSTARFSLKLDFEIMETMKSMYEVEQLTMKILQLMNQNKRWSVSGNIQDCSINILDIYIKGGK